MTMKPTHNAFQNVGSGYVNTSFASYVGQSSFGQSTFPLTGTGYINVAFNTSQYQAILIASNVVEEINEPANLNDPTVILIDWYLDAPLDLGEDVLISVPIEIDDPLNLGEDVVSQDYPDDGLDLGEDVYVDGPEVTSDSLNLGEDVLPMVVVYFEDSGDFDDDTEILQVAPLEDSFNLGEDLLFLLNLYIDDALNLGESVNANQAVVIPIDDTAGPVEEVQIRRTYNFSFSTEVQVAHQINSTSGGSFSTEIVISHFTPAPILTFTNPSNPFVPTIYIPGFGYLSTNGSTDKGVSSTAYVSVDDLGYAGICDLYSLNLNLQLGAGTFSILSYTDVPATLGAPFTLFGLTGICTSKGRVSSPNQGNLYKTEGVIGNSRNLNKQLLLVMDTSDLAPFQALAPNPLQSAPTRKWSSVAAMATGIANLCGFPLQWATADAPLLDTFLETGMTAGDAIRSLAARVGGILTYDGTGNWIVIDPVTGYGGWGGVPHCTLINGAEDANLLDLVGEVVSIPISPLTFGSAASVALNFKQSPPPPVNLLTTFRSSIPTNGSSVYINLPADYKESRSQLLLGPAHPPVPGGLPDDDGGPNSKQWTGFGGSIVTDDEGMKKLVVNSSHFDPDLVNGEFTYNIGYIRDSSGVDSSLSEYTNLLLQKQRLALQAEQERMRYFKKKVLQANFQFFGSVGIPGLLTTFMYNATNITGMIEQFTVSYANRQATCSMTIGEYVKLDLVNARSTLDAFLAGP